MIAGNSTGTEGWLITIKAGSTPVPATRLAEHRKVFGFLFLEGTAMCDCYTDKCKVCGEPVEMHLVDFATDQDEIEVYCEVHLPERRADGVLWEYADSPNERKKRVFVRWLTDNARQYASGNHPNAGEADVVDVPKGALAVQDERFLRYGSGG